MMEKILPPEEYRKGVYFESLDKRLIIDDLWLKSEEGLFLFEGSKDNTNLSKREISLLELNKRVKDFKDIQDQTSPKEIIIEAFIIRELLRLTSAHRTLIDDLDTRDLDIISLYLQDNFHLIEDQSIDLKKKIKKNLDLFFKREKISKYKSDTPIRLLSIVSLLGLYNFYHFTKNDDLYNKSSYISNSSSQQIDKIAKPVLYSIAQKKEGEISIPKNTPPITTAPKIETSAVQHMIPSSPSVAPLSPNGIKNMINQEAVSQYGYSPWEIFYLDYIVSIESKFNPNAINPKSGACGLMQQDPCEQQVNVQSQTVYWTLDSQIQSLFEYIKVRYQGDIVSAYNHECQFNWY